MRKIDKVIKKSLEDTPNLDKKINQNLAESFAQTNYQQGHSEDEDVTVFTVERYNRPTFARRMGAFAAAVAVCAAVGGSVVMMNGLREVPEAPLTDEVSEIPEDTEEPTEETAEEETEETEELSEERSLDEIFTAEFYAPEQQYASAEGYPENSYDMTTQEGIVAKMLNSVDFYDKAAGKFTQIYCAGDVLGGATEYDFAYDVTNGHQRMTNKTMVCLNSYEEIVAGEAPYGYKAGKLADLDYEAYCDGERAFVINVGGVEGTYSPWGGWERWVGYAYGGRDEGEVNLAQIRDNWDENSYWDIWKSDYQTFGDIKIRRKGIVMNYNYLNPYHRILKDLMDFDTWVFNPTNYLGRDAILIEGTIPQMNYDDWGDDPSGRYFYMTVDVKTGMMLKYVEYNDGTIYDFMVMNEIRFDDAVEDIPEEDINEYRLYTEADARDRGYKVNSKGETYGGVGGHSINPSNSDVLPDLIDFDKGYMKKQEIFDTIGDFDTKTRDLRQDFNRQEGDVLVYSMNLYDSEGEIVVGVVNYYDSPKN